MSQVGLLQTNTEAVVRYETSETPPSDFPRIAYFTESLLPWVDGVSRTLGVLFDTLEEHGHDFRIYAPIAPSAQYSWSNRVRKLRWLPFPLHMEYRLSLPQASRLARELDAFSPDLIHVCSPTPAGVWAQAYARSRGIPVVGSYHTNFAAYFGYYHAGFLEGSVWRGLRWFYNRCEATFAPSASAIRDLRKHGIRNTRIWSRGVDVNLFNPIHRDASLRSELGVDEDTALLLMVSRLVKEKDLLELIEADRIWSAGGLKYRLVLVGDGPLRPQLERGLPNAHFAGVQTGAELARYYASSDIFVFPSTTESFGNVVQEAMASGLPVVVANSGGPPGLVRPAVSGFIAGVHDPEDLAAKAATLIRDVDLRLTMGRNAREDAAARSWREVTNGLLRDYAAVQMRVRRRDARFRGRAASGLRALPWRRRALARN